MFKPKSMNWQKIETLVYQSISLQKLLDRKIKTLVDLHDTDFTKVDTCNRPIMFLFQAFVTLLK